MDITPILYYGSIMTVVALPSLGVGIGTGKASTAALDAINQAPRAQAEITKVTIISLALIETGAILGVVLGIILLGNNALTVTLYQAIAHWGIALALGFTGLIIGVASSLPSRAAAYAVARQPFFSANILNILLLTVSLIQTPVIFGFLISLIIRGQLSAVDSAADSIRLLASGLCFAIGSIGPGIGLARFAQIACKSLGINRDAYQKILPFTFISQAIIETPIIFALLISLILLSTPVQAGNLAAPFAFLAAAFCAGFGTLSPGISSGKTACTACEQISFEPNNYSILSKASMIAQGLIDAAAIYALLVALLILVLR